MSAVGDGGNDVSMIQVADAGVGIVGKVCYIEYIVHSSKNGLL